MKLNEIIDEKKFKNDMLEFLGFKDGGGTFLKEQYGDGSWHKIKKNIVNDIISVLDSCRKETILDLIESKEMTTLVFPKDDAEKIKKIAWAINVFWIERKNK